MLSLRETIALRIPKKWWLPLLLPVQMAIVYALSLFPDSVENLFTARLYTWIHAVRMFIFDVLPFSVGDIIYLLAIYLLVRWLWRTRRKWRREFAQQIASALSGISVFYFAFQLLWGLNYHRPDIQEKWNLNRDYTNEELVYFTKRLIEKTNHLHKQMMRDTTAPAVLSLSSENIYRQARKGFPPAARKHDIGPLNPVRAKTSLLRWPLTYMGFSGYLNPFTGEAQVNDLGPNYGLAATATHEMAHQLGYASEGEANFIGYLAAIENEENYVRYAGYTHALKYCLRSLQRSNPELAAQLVPLVNAGILENFDQSRQFWQSHENFLEPGFKWFYDHFLKWNHQDEGLLSYNRFVDLLVNYNYM